MKTPEAGDDRSGEIGSVVRDRAESLGRDWALEVRAATISERGRACGGWPGTLTEARIQVELELMPWLSECGRRLTGLAQSELVARLVYAAARTTWMSERQVEPRRSGDS